MVYPPAAGPVCTRCGAPAVVHWLRRLTDTELAAHIGLWESRRAEQLLMADPALPAPAHGPLPTAADCTTPVYGCADHAVSLEAAAFIHEAACTAPPTGHLPGCDCSPEPATQPEPAAPAQAALLPAHWTSE